MDKKFYQNQQKRLWQVFDSIRDFGLNDQDASILIYASLLLFKRKASALNQFSAHRNYSERMIYELFMPLNNERTYGKDLLDFIDSISKRLRRRDLSYFMDSIVDLGIVLDKNDDATPEEVDEEISKMIRLKGSRSSAGTAYSPWLNELLIHLSEKENVNSVIHLDCGNGETLIAFRKHFNNNVKIVGVEKVNQVRLVCNLRMAFLGYEIEVYPYESLLSEIKPHQFDVVVQPDLTSRSQKRHNQEFDSFDLSSLLNKNGKLFYLSYGGKLTDDLRHSNLEWFFTPEDIDLVIKCPPHVLMQTSLNLYLTVFYKHSNSASINFYDLSVKGYEPGRRFQSPEHAINFLSNSKLAEKEGTLVRVPKSEVFAIDDRRKLLPEFHAAMLRLRELEKDFPMAKPLKEFCQFSRGRASGRLKSKSPLKEGVHCVMITDLEDSSAELYVREASGIAREDEISRGTVLTNRCLVVPLIGKLKPKIFDPDLWEKEVYLNRNLVALIPEDDGVLLEYLIYQLQSPLVKQQIEMYAGSTLRHQLSLNDLKNIKIPLLPTAEEQKQFVTQAKMEILEREQNRVDSLRESLALKEQKEEAEFEIVRHIAHNLNPKLSEVSSVLGFIQKFIQERDLGSEALYEPLSKTDEVETVESAIAGALNKVKDMHKLIKSTRSLVAERIDSREFETVSCLDFLKELVEDGAIESSKAKIKILNKLKGSADLVRLHKGHFKELLESLVRNADVHGFESSNNKNEIRVEVSLDDGFVRLDYYNNGRPLPAELDTEKFLSFGVKSSSSPGDGLGGAFVRKVINAHEGSFEVMPISSGVHFTLHIPREQ